MRGYCPNCHSKLYPVDEESMQLVNVCSYCTTNISKYREALANKKGKGKNARKTKIVFQR